MSMYGMLFGQNPGTEVLLAAAGLTGYDVGRLRDAWAELGDDGQVVIVVYTRNGGGNRVECWGANWPTASGQSCRCPACAANYHLPSLPNHLGGTDDTFDDTYRTERFRPLGGLTEDLLALVHDTPRDPSLEWRRMLDRLAGKETPDAT